jgi:hypothetical protein
MVGQSGPRNTCSPTASRLRNPCQGDDGARVPYHPDEQDEVMSDALAYGGPAFVDEVTLDAIAMADAVAPWDGTGNEPPARRSVWIAAA